MYVEHLVECFQAVKRVLRDDGTLWLNLGDSYVTQPAGNKTPSGFSQKSSAALSGALAQYGTLKRQPKSDLAPKNLIGQPWRVAFALQADGWYLRSAMPWVKRSAMPEAVTDRPTSALEYVFLLTKSPRYFWDAEAVRVKAAPATHQRDKYSRILADDGPQAVRHDHETQVDPGGRNFRNTDLFFESLKPPYGMIFAGNEPVGLDVTSAGLNEKHFASFPRKLIRPLILASTSSKGCCPECGTPWVRVVEKGELTPRDENKYDKKPYGIVVDDPDSSDQGRNRARDGHRANMHHPVKTLGWRAGCEYGLGCKDWEPVPCTVLDPMCGSGTSLIVATQQGRRGIGIDASAEYCEMARRRIADPEPEAEIPDVEGQMMFEELAT